MTLYITETENTTTDVG